MASPPAPHRLRVVDPGELTAADLDAWHAIRAADPNLDSPYFHPRFAAVVAETRPGVRVIVDESVGGAPRSFLPVQVDGRSCLPVGFPAADFQGPICRPDYELDVAAAIRACGASSFHFDHLRDGVRGLERWTVGEQPSPFVDISGGMDGYLARASRSGKDNLAQARRHTRRAERDLGPVRFVANSDDPAVLDAVVALKRQQYRATGARDYFADNGHVRLLEKLRNEDSADFAGVLSAVYAGPHLLAAHFGLRSGPVLHWWFPVYDPEFSRLSPGWLLLKALIEAGPDLGFERIDLGRGEDEYKRRAMTGHQTVRQGAVVLNPLARKAQDARRRAVVALKSSRLAPTLRRGLHRARRLIR
jgi:CelD/BcsL family acetyltransferase involved in cellulose biosynthesis